MINEMEYRLSIPVKGVEVLYFTAPTYAHQDFTCLVETTVSKEAYRMAMEMRAGKTKEEIAEAEKSAKDASTSEAESLEQKEEYLKLVLRNSGTVREVAQAFVKMCAGTDVCKSNGAPVPMDVWKGILDKDVKGAMYRYIANFIQ